MSFDLVGTTRAMARWMPKISEFFGIVIAMYYADHAPPHFHARYGEHDAAIRIDPPGVLEGYLPPRALGLVMEWLAPNCEALVADWERARQGLPLVPVPPLA